MTERDVVRDLTLDGNAVAGLLEEVFGGDMTTADGRCAHCGSTNALGALLAYVRAPGVVLRCPACTEVVARIVQTPRETLVDLRGAAHLAIRR